MRKQGSSVSCIGIGISLELVCQECGRVCLSKAGLLSHLRSHNVNQLVYYSNHDVAICYQYSKECKSVPGLKRHMGIHGASTANLSTQRNFCCNFGGLNINHWQGK